MSKVKKISAIILTMVLLIGCMWVCDSDALDPIKIIIDGKVITSDTPPQIINNRVFLPVRAITESLGMQVSWDEAERTVNITSKQPAQPTSVQPKYMKVNGEATTWPYWEENGNIYMEYHNAMELLRTVFNPIFEPISYSATNKTMFIGNHTVDLFFYKKDGFNTISISEFKRTHLIDYEWNEKDGNIVMKKL